MKPYIKQSLWAGATLALMSSCGTVFEDGEVCSTPVVAPPVYQVRFDDSRNMNFADAFAAEVNSVKLFVIDSQTQEIMLQLEETDADKLHTPGYTLELPLPSSSPATPVPDYTNRPIDLVAWCGLNAEDENGLYSFTLTNDYLASGQKNRIEDLGARLYGNLSAPMDRHLNELHHGMLLGQTIMGGRDTTLVVPLVRNTNNIRVVLQRIDGTALHEQDFDFEITSDNALMNWDNTLEETGKPVTYTQYVKRDNTSTTGGQIVVGELSTGRMVKERAMRLRAKYEGKTLLDIPLITYALLVKGYYNEAMSDQEFLDRQNDWSFIFFLNEQNQWEHSNLYINDWHVVIDNVEL